MQASHDGGHQATPLNMYVTMTTSVLMVSMVLDVEVHHQGRSLQGLFHVASHLGCHQGYHPDVALRWEVAMPTSPPVLIA